MSSTLSISAPLTIDLFIPALSFHSKVTRWSDELSISKNGQLATINWQHTSPLVRTLTKIYNCVAGLFETVVSTIFHHRLVFTDRSWKKQPLTNTVTIFRETFGQHRFDRAAKWAEINLGENRAELLTKKEVSALLHALELVTLEDVEELLEEIHGPNDGIRASLQRADVQSLREQFAGKRTIESCSFEDIQQLETLLLPFKDPLTQFWNDPASHFNSLSVIGSSYNSTETVAWALHLLRTKKLSLNDWEALCAKRLAQPQIPANLLIPHPNGGYVCFSHRIEGGGASKRFLRSIHPEKVPPLILYRGTRGPSTGAAIKDVVLSWLEDLRKELGSSGPMTTYEETKDLLLNPERGFVNSPNQPVWLVTNSIGGPQAMRDAILFHRRVTRLSTNSSPGVDTETAELFRQVMKEPRQTPMTIIHTIDTGDIVDTVGDEHLGGNCDHVSLTFRSLSPLSGDSSPRSGLRNTLRDFFLSSPALIERVWGIFQAHTRATVAYPYREEILSTDTPETKTQANSYAQHRPPHFDPSWEQVRTFICPAPSPGFAAFARQHI